MRQQSENEATLLSLHETTVVYEERAKVVEALNARVSKVDEMRQQSENEAKENIQAMIKENKDSIDKITESVNEALEDMEEKYKADGVSFKDSLSNYQELLERKLKEVDNNTNLNSSSILDIKTSLTDQ